MKCKDLQYKMVGNAGQLTLAEQEHLRQCANCNAFMQDQSKLMTLMQKSKIQTPLALRQSTLESWHSLSRNRFPGKISFVERMFELWQSPRSVLIMGVFFVVGILFILFAPGFETESELLDQFLSNMVLIVIMQNFVAAMFIPLLLFRSFSRKKF